MLYDDCYREPPEPEQRKVVTDWSDDLVMVRVGKLSLGIEANLEILKVVVDVLEFTQMLSEIERDQMSDDVARVALSMEGK
jgi:hypothetical protein